MNTHFRPQHLPLTTQAAEGLARRLWSWDEIVGIMVETAPKPGRPETYKKQQYAD